MNTSSMLKFWFIIFLTCSSLFPQESYHLITFSKGASLTEGDDNYYQIVFIAVPNSVADTLYINLFDPDFGGSNDQRKGDWDSQTKFSLYGGSDIALDVMSKTIEPAMTDVRKGNVIFEKIYSINPALDNEWTSFCKIAPQQGFLDGGFRIFKLVIEGLNGDDGNIFDVQISLSPTKYLSVKDVEMYSFCPTVRINKKDSNPILRFFSSSVASLEIMSYDAAGAPLLLETPVRSGVKLATSGQSEWVSSSIKLNEFETNSTLGIIAGKGSENPNDVTFACREPNGQFLKFQLPIYPFIENHPPAIVKNFNILADCYTAVFDASQSSDRDGDDLVYFWNYGDGSSAGGVRVVHTFKEKKSYPIALLVKDNSGAVHNGSYEYFQVPINNEPIPAMSFKATAAPGETVTFSAEQSRDGDGAVIESNWDFGDGSTARGTTVNHSFAIPGKYTITLSVKDNSVSPCNTASMTKQIWINAQPRSVAGNDFWMSPGEECSFNGKNSSDPDGRIVRYKWDFGDGQSSEGLTVKHRYAVRGFYKVKLTVEDDAGVSNSQAVSELTAKINTSPIAVAGNDRISAPGEVQFFDGGQSADPDGFITKYEWDLGDGTQVAGMKISHSYQKPGKYKVTLKVTDNSGTSTKENSNSLNVLVNQQPEVSIAQGIHVTYSTIQFKGDKAFDADGQIISYLWNFGDGMTSSEKNPTHTYQNYGVYTVTLKVKDNSEAINNTAETSAKVIINAKPIADAGADQSASPQQELLFDASNSFDPDGSIAKFEWNLGDGMLLEGRKITHAYKLPGIYNVQLKVSDNTGQPEAIDFAGLTVTVNTQPRAIAGNSILTEPGQSFILDGSRSYDPDGNITQYRWEIFPGKTIFNEAKVAHAIADPGIYYAVLTVKDKSDTRNSTSTDTVLIKINSRPHADAGKDVYTCNSKIAFDGSGSSDADGDPLSYVWDFGDHSSPEKGVQFVHTYTKGGIYPVILTVNDGMGLPNSISTSAIKVIINEPPIANAGPDQIICAGETMRFNAGESKDPEGGALKYTWDFGDGTAGEGINPTKIYKVGGVYQIKLKVEDDSGLPCNWDITTKMLVVSESPVANAGPDITSCANTVIQFDGTKSKDYDGVVNSYSWDFGDGTISGGATPTHGYAKAGTYRVVLTIVGDSKGDCDNTDTDELIVTVMEAPKVDFDVPQNFPINKTLALTAVPTVASGIKVTEIIWDFGDGTSASGPSVTKTYPKAGSFFIGVTMKTDAKTECHTAYIKKLIITNEPPVASILAPQKIGINQPVLFDGSASRDNDGSIQSYSWDFGDGTQGTGINAVHRYQNPGSYQVTLTVKDNTPLENNHSSQAFKIRVNKTPVPFAEIRTAVCPNEDVTFDASRSSDADGQIKDYHWDFGDGYSASGKVVHHTYKIKGEYYVTLAVDDGDSLSNSRAELVKRVQVNSTPQVVIGQPPIVCTGEEFVIVPKKVFDADNDSLTYLWVLSDGRKYNTLKLSHVFSKPGNYSAVLKVGDNQGTACSFGIDSVQFVVNSQPAANAGKDRQGFTGGLHDEMLFDASLSTDVDNDALQYIWDFGDGTKGYGIKLYHLFEEAGTYKVTLTVNDGRGTRCSSSAHTISVTIVERNKN